jgi:hypothetical protein
VSYLELTDGLDPAAVGVHALAAAQAAVGGTNGLVSRAELQRRGMTDELERELLESGLCRLATGELLAVAVDPINEASIRLEQRLASEARRRQRRREDPASSDQTARVARAVPPRTGPPANSGVLAEAPAGTSLTRGRGRAAHTHQSFLLNVVNSEGKGRDEEPTHTVACAGAGARELVPAIREVLAEAFAPGDISDGELRTGIQLAQHHGLDPLVVALEAAAMGSSASWRTRAAGATMAIAVRKLVRAAAVPTASNPVAAARPSACPLPALSPEERVELAQRWDAIAAVARAQLTDSSFELWLADCRLHHVGEETVTIAAPTSSASWVGDRFTHVLEAAAAATVGDQVLADVVACQCADQPAARRSA